MIRLFDWIPAPAPDPIRGSSESRVPGENRDPVSRMAPGFRRDDVWTPVFGELSRAVSTGVTTFYEIITICSSYKNCSLLIPPALHKI